MCTLGSIREQGQAGSTGAGKRIVLATWGSFGDLHPFMGLGLGLKARGHRVVLATTSAYREKVEGEGLEFHPMRPDLPEADKVPEMIRRIMDSKTGTEAVVRHTLMAHIREQYDDLLAITRTADLLVSHPIVHSAPSVAEKLGKPRVNALLQPMVFVSSYEPPVPPEAPGMAALYRLGPGFNRLFMNAVKGRFRHWSEPLDRLREAEGLPPGKCPIFESHYSPLLNLALFSRMLGEPQPDWPENTVLCGFPFYDRLTATTGMPAELEQFLAAGEPPIVFTLGTSAVYSAGDFYRESIEAVRRMGRRAVMLVGLEGLNEMPQPLPDGIIAVPYAPHGELFRRAAAIVHQGGVGTTGQALRSGKPTLVVPFAHDQPDNATRVTRQGGARWILRSRYNRTTAERELRTLLEDPRYARRAAEVGEFVRSEDGVGTACDAIEKLISTGLCETPRRLDHR